RAALGSGRAQLVRLLLAESVLLAIAGMAAGLVLARWATTLLVAWFTPAIDVPVQLDFEYDWHIFAYAALVALGAGVPTGLVPGAAGGEGGGGELGARGRGAGRGGGGVGGWGGWIATAPTGWSWSTRRSPAACGRPPIRSASGSRFPCPRPGPAA